MPLNQKNQTNPLFFYKDGFGIKHPMKVDMPLNKETKMKQNLWFFK